MTAPLRSVDAVVVTYRPDLRRLLASLDAVDPQVRQIFVVDNGDGLALGEALAGRPRTRLLVMGENRGIGAAQNAGAKAAIEAGADFLLLLDQDSVAAPDMVARLRAACDTLQASGRKVGAVGPRAPSRDEPGVFVRLGWFRYLPVEVPPQAEVVLCDMLIASGCLIPATAFAAVGPMDESLFIDKVDTEWCLRAASRGFVLAGVPGALLHHQLGERTLRIWWRGWRLVPAHQPFRYYYIIRNGLRVARLPHATWKWRSADCAHSLLILLFFGFYAPQCGANLRHMARGFLAGFRRRGGPLPEPAGRRVG